MKIIVVGDGKVGLTLTEQLSKEEHDIVVIDKNPTVLQNSQETFDVMVVPGNGASRQVLLEAGAQDADLVIAATSADEINLLCCLTAKKLGCTHTTVSYTHLDVYKRQSCNRRVACSLILLRTCSSRSERS